MGLIYAHATQPGNHNPNAKKQYALRLLKIQKAKQEKKGK
jgi:hypothetical protein